MNIVCLDMEGSSGSGNLDRIRRSHRNRRIEENYARRAGYDKLMEYRLNILKEHGLGTKRSRIRSAKSIRCRVQRNFWTSAQHHAGHHHQRHIRTVRTASDEKAGLADTVLQHAGNRRRRHDLKA